MAKKPAPDPSPDKLIRDQPRQYHTADGRFEVQAATTGTWYLTDNEQTDDFGLPVLLGPYVTLDAVKEAVAAGRAGKLEAPGKAVARAPEPVPSGKRPALRVVKADEGVDDESDEATPRVQPKAASKAAAKPPAKLEPPAKSPKKPTWLDRLDPAEQRRARGLIEALEAEGVEDGDAIVRADFDAGLPQVARTLLLERIWRVAIEPWADEGWVTESSRKRSGRAVQRDAADALRRLDEAGAEPGDLALVARLVATRTAGRVLEQLTLEGGAKGRKHLPGWRMTEIRADDERPDRPILLSEEDVLRAAPSPATGSSPTTGD